MLESYSPASNLGNATSSTAALRIFYINSRGLKGLGGKGDTAMETGEGAKLLLEDFEVKGSQRRGFEKRQNLMLR